MCLRELKSGKIVQNKFLCLAKAKDKIFFCARLLLFSSPVGQKEENFTQR